MGIQNLEIRLSAHEFQSSKLVYHRKIQIWNNLMDVYKKVCPLNWHNLKFSVVY